MLAIPARLIADDVDIMIGVATPVAMAMQAATEDNGIPVVFAAVSDPVGYLLGSKKLKIKTPARSDHN